jgi:site-specific DNA-methyltransferase (adenine-specific)
MTNEPLAFHPVAELFPALRPDEYAALVEDIRAHGLIDPIWLYEGQIIDGRHRYRACLECGVAPLFRDWHGQGSLVQFVVSVNLRRRQLSDDQMMVVNLNIERALADEAAEHRRRAVAEANHQRSQPAIPMSAIPADIGIAGEQPSPKIVRHRPDATERAARLLGVSRQKMRDAKKVRDHAPELAKQVYDGSLPLADAVKVVRKQEAARKAAEPKPLVARALLPVTLEVADACHLPLDDETVHLIVTSPPYGVGISYHGMSDEAGGWRALLVDSLREAYRVGKRGARLALNVPLDTTEPVERPCYAQAVDAALEAGWSYRTTIIWNKNNINKSTARGSVDSAAAPHVIARVEMIAVFYREEWHRDGPACIDRENWLDWTNGLWSFRGESYPWEGHPAPFPEELPQRLITLFSFPGDTVLDPFVGSGTTVVVAHRLGRQAIGYDQSQQYIEAAARRMATSI